MDCKELEQEQQDRGDVRDIHRTLQIASAQTDEEKQRKAILEVEFKAALLMLKLRRTQLHTERINKKIARRKLQKLYEKEDRYEDDDEDEEDVEDGHDNNQRWEGYPRTPWIPIKTSDESVEEKVPDLVANKSDNN